MYHRRRDRRDGYERGYFEAVVRDCVGTGMEQGHQEAMKRDENLGRETLKGYGRIS